MSATLSITCDADHCDAQVNTRAGEPWWGQMEAERQGWSCSEDGDLCPIHADTPDQSTFHLAA